MIVNNSTIINKRDNHSMITKKRSWHMTLNNPGPDLGLAQKCDEVICIECIQYPVSFSFSIYRLAQPPAKLHSTFQASWQYRGRRKQIKSVTYLWWRRTVVLILIIWFENCTKYVINHISAAALTTGRMIP